MFSGLRKYISIKPTNPLVQSVRYKNVINTRKPRNDHFWAKKLKIVYRPIKPPEFDRHLPMSYKCRKQFTKALFALQSEEENPYERILANEIKDNVVPSKMLLVLHQNPASADNLFESGKEFKKSGMKVIINSKTTVKMALEDTKFVNVLNLYQKNTKTILISSPEVKLNIALALLKKMPFYILLAGIVEDRFLYRSQLEEYAKAKNIDEVRAQLVAILNTPSMLLTQGLTYHQMTTVGYLDEIIKMKSNKEASNTTSNSSQTKTSNAEEVKTTDSTKPDENK